MCILNDKKVVIGLVTKLEDNIEKYLLVSSKKDFKEFTGFYYPLGGYIEDNESEENDLKRELTEELNLEVLASLKITESFRDVKNQIIYWYK